MWMMNRYNPYEYGERKRRALATEEEARLFNVSGAFWFTFTLLNWQGEWTSAGALDNTKVSHVSLIDVGKSINDVLINLND